MSVISSATLSSLTAQSVTLSVSAANVANLRSVGLREDGFDPGFEAYVPHRVVQVSGPGGSVKAVSLPIDPPSVLVYAPNDPTADPEGLVAVPNISLEEEFVVQLQAKIAYKANLGALRTQTEVLGDLLDIVS